MGEILGGVGDGAVGGAVGGVALSRSAPDLVDSGGTFAAGAASGGAPFCGGAFSEGAVGI